MRQVKKQEMSYKRRWGYPSRIASAILAAGLVLSMGSSAFAAEARHGRGSGYMLHKADGTAYTSRELTKKEREHYLDWEASIYDTDRSVYTSSNQMHVLRIGVGETVVLHAAQETIRFKKKGVRSLYRYYMGDEPSVGLKTVAGVEGLDTYTKKNLFHTKSDGEDYYCLEWYVTGLTEGVDYIWYFDNPFEPQYLKIVVGERSGTQDASNKSK